MDHLLALKLCFSVCVVGAAVCLACLICRTMRKGFRWALGITALVGAWLLYYPIYANEAEQLFQPIVRAGYATVRLFLVDGDFEFVQNSLLQVDKTLLQFKWGLSYETMMLVMYIMAPVTTITAIATLFREPLSWLWLRTGRLLARWFVFSELSDRSLALAEDIRNKFGFCTTIVFHDVYRKNAEPDAELLERAERLRAICFKKDVTHLKRPLTPFRVEFFIIGANESENLDQAVRLAERYKKRRNTAIYVWARGAESECVLDCVDTAVKRRRQKGTNSSLDKRIFKLRRIDDVEIFAWNTLRDADLFKNMQTYGGENLISILIVGMGDYGDAFLRAAVWMYQRDDVRLEINVVDTRGDVRKRLQHQYPELIEKNDCDEDGEAHYSIRFLENTDLFAGDLEEILLNDGAEHMQMRARLNRTTVAFVTLGDDDINIRAALELRQLFDRAQYNAKNQSKAISLCSKELEEADRLENGGELIEEEKESEDQPENNARYIRLVRWVKKRFAKKAEQPEEAETKSAEERKREKIKSLRGKVGKTLRANVESMTQPAICTPVYDERKIGIVTLRDTADEAHQLRSADGTAYNIQFMGSFRAQNQYDTIARETLEKDALAYHMQWSSIGYDEENLQKYDRYEYYRHSSMAQATHKKMIAEHLKLQCLEPEKDQQKTPAAEAANDGKDKQKTPAAETTSSGRDKQKENALKAERECHCAACERSKKIEHMRWNAYMRTRGYCCPKTQMQYQVKSFRGKLHWELVDYYKLDEVEKSKDATAVPAK